MSISADHRPGVEVELTGIFTNQDEPSKQLALYTEYAANTDGRTPIGTFYGHVTDRYRSDKEKLPRNHPAVVLVLGETATEFARS